MAEQYDVLIIGSGQAGNPLSSAFAAAGRRVALVERAQVGGTCINYGCTPTKTMVASAQRAWQAQHGAALGVIAADVHVDLAKVRARKRSIVEQFRASNEGRFDQGSPELVRGEARFTGPKEIAVALQGGGERRLTAETIVIDTGASPRMPEVPGLDAVPALTNESLMELDQTPEHLVVLGGGYLALEFGQMFRRFGSAVTLIERGARLLANEDPDVSDAVASILREDGIVLQMGSTAARVEGGRGSVTVHLDDGTRVSGSHLLIAVGRSPNTAALALDTAGVATDAHGYVQVDDELRTSVAGIYAVGDVTGGPQFTHVAYDDFRILRENLITGKAKRRTTDRIPVYVVYMDPQLGRVGMTQTQALKAGHKVRVAKMPVTSIARATEVNETRGFLKAVVDADTNKILGAAMLAPEGGELMSMVQIAMMGALSYQMLEEAVFAHPAYAEALNTLWGHFEA